MRTVVEANLLIFAAFPYLGVFIGHLLSPNRQVWLVSIALLLLIPKLTPYRYTAGWFDELLMTFVLAGSFSLVTLLLGKTRPGVVLPFLLTLVLVIRLGFEVWVDIFKGTQTVEQSWVVNDYRIEYIRDQGFSGGAQLKYHLEQYAFFHLFIRDVDTAFVKYEEAAACVITFKSTRTTFNKCTGQLTKPGR